MFKFAFASFFFFFTLNSFSGISYQFDGIENHPSNPLNTLREFNPSSPLNINFYSSDEDINKLRKVEIIKNSNTDTPELMHKYLTGDIIETATFSIQINPSSYIKYVMHNVRIVFFEISGPSGSNNENSLNRIVLECDKLVWYYENLWENSIGNIFAWDFTTNQEIKDFTNISNYKILRR